VGKGKRRFTPTQTYDQTLSAASIITLNFDHDPAKNTAGQILKYGAGDGPNGEVQGAYLYYLNGSTWTKTIFDTTAEMGNGKLLGYALGTPGEYSGTPEKIGMLLTGITTGYVLGGATVGGLIYGAPSKAGWLSTSAATINKILGHVLKVDANILTKCLIRFNPDISYD